MGKLIEKACNKHCYISKKDALTRLNELRRHKAKFIGGRLQKRKIKHRACRAYFCPQCQSWHLTSKNNYICEN